MPTNTICAELKGGIDYSCLRKVTRGYYQEAVAINFSDIDREASQVNVGDVAGCDYTVSLVLKPGKTGYRIKLPDNGSTIKAIVDKKNNDKGIVGYIHKTQILAMGVGTETKCTLDKLDHGLYVFALQAKDGTVEILGYENGISTGEYTYDITEGGGGSIIPLQTKESEPESTLPLVYKAALEGNASADFDSLFAGPAV